jgi:hypothetical protein
MRIRTTWPPQSALAATMTRVRFLDNCGPYRAMELASFLPEDAAALLNAGLAVAA